MQLLAAAVPVLDGQTNASRTAAHTLGRKRNCSVPIAAIRLSDSRSRIAVVDGRRSARPEAILRALVSAPQACSNRVASSIGAAPSCGSMGPWTRRKATWVRAGHPPAHWRQPRVLVTPFSSRNKLRSASLLLASRAPPAAPRNGGRRAAALLPLIPR